MSASELVLLDSEGKQLHCLLSPMLLPAGTQGVLMLVEPPSSPSDVIDSLMRGYRLTSAEAAVAQALASERPVSEIADARGVSIATVRAQLRSIFEKTGVRSQAQLVALVARLTRRRSRR